MQPFERVVGRPPDRAGLKVPGIFAIEAGAGNAGFLPYREADERSAPAAGAPTRAAGEPIGLDAAGGEAFVFDRRGGQRVARQDREGLDPRSRTDPAGPARLQKKNNPPPPNGQGKFE